VSLDALDPEVFARMNGMGAKIERVLSGIAAAQNFGLPVKVNAVIQRGVNESEILPLAEWARGSGVTLRFIEYMDVGETNGWWKVDVVSAKEILTAVTGRFPSEPVIEREKGGVATRYRYLDGGGEFGIISSVSAPFCRDCQRLRLSADGKLFTCLFASGGSDIRPMVRGESGEDLETFLRRLWGQRHDRYSELRGESAPPKAEMSYLGG
jgi:cyclic pyranopterin phosphate synthase